MSFEEALAQCLKALEQGQTVEDCLARYPGYREALAPLLYTATQLRTGPKPQLSDQAFARGRAVLAAHAKHQQQLLAPFVVTPNQAVFATQTKKTLIKPAANSPLPLPKPAPIFVRWHQYTRLFIVFFLLLSMASFVRSIRTSLPGSLFYSVKMMGENAQGLLMAAAGQQATWHAHQVELRLQEIALLARQGQPIEPTLNTAIDEHLQAALNASATLPDAVRGNFLATWLEHLHALQQEMPAQSTTVATLARTIATVEAATQEVKTPTVLQLVNTPTSTPPADVPTATATRSLLPTITPADTEEPATVAPSVIPGVVPGILATATPDPSIPTLAPFATAQQDNDNGAVTLVGLPTATQATQLLPLESDNHSSGQSSDENKQAAASAPTETPELASATPTATLEQTPLTASPTGQFEATPTPDSAHTPTPEDKSTPVIQTTPDPIEPTATDEGELPPTPPSEPTSDEPPTPTESAKSTATDEATKATDTPDDESSETPEPTRVKEDKTSTPEPTQVSEPKETAEATPVPDDDQAKSSPSNPRPTPTKTPKRPKK